MLIELKNISPRYLEQEKIEGSEVWEQGLVFTKPDIVEIVASSGRGKSSLINFIYGTKSDFKGSIMIDNIAVEKQSAEFLTSLRTKKLSVVFQDLRLFETRTCLENILVKRALAPFAQEDTIMHMADSLGVRNKLGSTAGNCSYGERQRIAIIRALQQPFDFILLDEPFSHLDDRNRDLALKLILEEASKRKAGIILADLETNKNFPATKRIRL
jgi:putative ABC transport system ATP-binding protein